MDFFWSKHFFSLCKKVSHAELRQPQVMALREPRPLALTESIVLPEKVKSKGRPEDLVAGRWRQSQKRCLKNLWGPHFFGVLIKWSPYCLMLQSWKIEILHEESLLIVPVQHTFRALFMLLLYRFVNQLRCPIYSYLHTAFLPLPVPSPAPAPPPPQNIPFP